MRNKKGILCCDVCKKPIEELTEEKALEEMEGHGWTNHDTAQMHGCFHCRNRFDRWGQPFIYETYFAGRYEDLPDGTRKVFAGFDGVYSIRDRDEMKSGGITLTPLPLRSRGDIISVNRLHSTSPLRNSSRSVQTVLSDSFG